MLPRLRAGNRWGPLVRKNKTNESKPETLADSTLWDAVLRDILIPRIAEANGDAAAPFDADTFRALLAPTAQDDEPAATDPEIVATAFTGAAASALLTSLQAVDWLQNRFGADIDNESVFGPPQLTVSENGVGAAVGSVSMETLGVDVAARARNALVNLGDRAIIGADAGDLAGGMFLVIDANGQAGFQYGEDEILVLFRGLPSTDLSVEFPVI